MWRMWANSSEASVDPAVSNALLRRAPVASLLALAALVAACAPSAAGDVVRDHAFSVGQSPKLVVESDGGRIDVTAGPPGVIVVQSSIQNPATLIYEVRREGDTIIVTAKQQPGLRNLANVNSTVADIIITAPSTTFIDLTTNNGDVAIKGILASAKVVTSNAGITLENVRGNLNVSPTDGPIRRNTPSGHAPL